MLARMAAACPAVLQSLFDTVRDIFATAPAALNDSARTVLAAGIRGGSVGALGVFADAGFSAAAGRQPPPVLANAVADALLHASLPAVAVLARRLAVTPVQFPQEYFGAVVGAILCGDFERVRVFIAAGGLPAAICGSKALVQALLKAKRLDAARALFAEKCFAGALEPAAAAMFARAAAAAEQLDCLETLAGMATDAETSASTSTSTSTSASTPAEGAVGFSLSQIARTLSASALEALARMVRRLAAGDTQGAAQAGEIAAWALRAARTNADDLCADSGRLLRVWLESLPADAPGFDPEELSESRTRRGRGRPVSVGLEAAIGAGFDLLEAHAGLAAIPAAVAAELIKSDKPLALTAITLRFRSAELLAVAGATVAAFAIRTGRGGLLAWVLKQAPSTSKAFLKMEHFVRLATARKYVRVLALLHDQVPAEWIK